MLDQILRYKREELEHLKRKMRLVDVRKKAEDAGPVRGFLKDCRTGLTGPTCQTSIIAEIKKASPSAGVIREKFDPVGLAMEFEEAGAAALSVLTDEHFFQGSLKNLTDIRSKASLPLSRKDFVFDEYQIYEARGAGADAILLIVRILEDSQLKDYSDLAQESGMAALIEIHDEKDLARVGSSCRLLGINNRDLDSLKTDLATTEKLVPKIPKETVVISESGISERRDIERLKKSGVHAFLVGEALLKEKEPGKKLRELLSA